MRNLIWLLVVILVAVTAAYPFSRRRNVEATPSGRGKIERNLPGREFSAAPSEGGHRILIEAEDAAQIESPMSVLANVAERTEGASKKGCVYLGPEKVNLDPACLKQGKKPYPSAMYPGFARYDFKAPSTGAYDLWLRAWWVNDCGNSVFVSIDEVDEKDLPKPLTAPLPLGGSTFGCWTWNPLKRKGVPVLLDLKEGQRYSIYIANREDDLYFDQILMRGTDRNWPDPTWIAE